MSPLPLPALSRNDEARIHSVAAPRQLRDHLQDLGLVPGNRVRLLQTGSPCILLIDGSTRLCLRSEEAESVLVHLS